jgi:hypothetical protein
MEQLEGLTYKQHPTYHHLYGTTDGRVFSSKSKKFVGIERPAHNRAYVHVTSVLPRVNRMLFRYRIIWECFHGKLSSTTDIDHINQNSLDDRLSNLQPLTRREHVQKTRADNPGLSQKISATLKYTFQAVKGSERRTGNDKRFVSYFGFKTTRTFKNHMRAHDYKMCIDGWTITLCAEEIEGEVWKTGLINGVEYTVSNMGRGKSGQRISYGNLQNGYQRIGNKNYKVHRAVCTLFNGPPPSALHQVDHINGNKTDNRSVNLEWVIPAENMRRMAALKRFVSSRMEEDVDE